MFYGHKTVMFSPAATLTFDVLT